MFSYMYLYTCILASFDPESYLLMMESGNTSAHNSNTTSNDVSTASTIDTINNDNMPLNSNSNLLRVKLRRGLIGLPAHFREHVRALGLRHTHQKSYLPINPHVVGNILKVKELVEVRRVAGRPPAGKTSYWAKGYSLIKRALP